MADLNRQTGANVDPNADPNDLMTSNARGLMAVVSSLPELTERKRAIDKHMNIATHMLKVHCYVILHSHETLVLQAGSPYVYQGNVGLSICMYVVKHVSEMCLFWVCTKKAVLLPMWHAANISCSLCVLTDAHL